MQRNIEGAASKDCVNMEDNGMVELFLCCKYQRHKIIMFKAQEDFLQKCVLTNWEQL